jgi:SagB-type dehydrogenase family enzyme
MLSATSVLSGAKGSAGRLDSSLLATLLFLSAGVTRITGPPNARTYFRAAMSAGNLHPVEVYVAVGEVAGIEPGVYHFSPLDVALTRLRDGDHRGILGADAPLVVILTGIPWRTAWKYGERGWRHLYWDAGTMLANLLAVADAHGLRHKTVVGFDDAGVANLLGIDGVGEMPLAMVQLGAAGSEPPPPSDLGPISVDVAPVAPRPIRLPLLEEAQSDGALGGEEVGVWRSKGMQVAGSAPARVDSPSNGTDPIEQVILRRGSTRRMAHRAVPRQHLDWPMAASTRAVGLDLAPEGTLLDHYLNVHAVEEFEPGAYRHTGEAVELLGRVDSIREKSAALCLGQPLGGDSAYTVFHCAELDPIIESLGSRGYRAAQLESGVVSGRLALCAFALGLGATGLTFFDDLVSHFFATSSQPMLVTSLGVPTGSPAPAGSPGRPAMIRRNA